MSVDVDTQLRPSYATRSALPQLAFWPGGGGKLEDSAKPKDTYHIVGSWSSFSTSAPMEKDGKDLYSYIVTIGANGFEQFQICLDGDMDKMLTPEAPVAAAYSTVQGPVTQDDAKGLEWVIGNPSRHDSQDALTNGSVAASSGEKYMVKLRIAGKWRTVDWVCTEPASPEMQPVDDGQYFISASWSSWACDQQLVSVGHGKYQADVALPSSRGRFQVVRNRDWNQTFYPIGTEVIGPGFAPSNCSWSVSGASGDIVRIVLQRSWKEGRWTQIVNWEKTGSKPSSALADPAWPRFFLVGAGTTVKLEMEPVSSLCYSITLQLTEGDVPFQILYDGDFRRVFYPSVKRATPSISHKILGPDLPLDSRSSWLIKRDLDDTSKEGGWYTVELTVSAADHMPAAIRWKRVA